MGRWSPGEPMTRWSRLLGKAAQGPDPGAGTRPGQEDHGGGDPAGRDPHRPRKKTSLADALAQEGRFPVKAIMAPLGVSRKQPYFFRRWFTVTFTEPDALPPRPSLTVTVTLYTVVTVTRGGG